MWKYDFVTREEFEKVKDKVEDFIIMLGGKVFSVELPYIQKEISYSGDCVVEMCIRDSNKAILRWLL